MGQCRGCGSCNIDEEHGVSNPDPRWMHPPTDPFTGTTATWRTVRNHWRGLENNILYRLRTALKKDNLDTSWDGVVDRRLELIGWFELFNQVKYHIDPDEHSVGCKPCGFQSTPTTDPMEDMSLHDEWLANGPLWYATEWEPFGVWDKYDMAWDKAHPLE